MSITSLPSLRVLSPVPHVIAFYDGRTETPHPPQTWVDDGALSLGIASYAIVSGDEALVYDTHVSLDHARFIRNHLHTMGVNRFTVVLSHWHLDHIAGNEVFGDCEIIANEKTLAHLNANKGAIETGELSGPPAISPLILPNRTFIGSMALRIGDLDLELIETNIHSNDATLVWWPKMRLLLAGDALEDCITYVDEPRDLPTHLENLEKLWELNPRRILPCHGDPDVITEGGYDKPFIRANQQYIRMLMHAVTDPELRAKPLAELIRGPLDLGWIRYYEPYERIHAQNLERVLKAFQQ